MLILCKKCGKLFDSLARNALYCQKCRGTVRYYTVNKTVVKFCETCGAKIKTSRKNQRFCNDRCRAAYHFPKVESIVQCAYCGKTFVATTAKKKYCGMSCYDGAKRLRDEERRKDKSE